MSSHERSSRRCLPLIPLICLLSGAPVFAQQQSSGGGSSWHPIKGTPGKASSTAQISFRDLAAQSAGKPEIASSADDDEDGNSTTLDLPVDPNGPATVDRAGRAAAPTTARPALLPSIASPGASPSFLALDDDNTQTPPDTHGAVGPNHIMTVLNTQYRIQDKSGAVISTVSIGTFWSAVGPPSPTWDSKVIYDPYGARWIVVSGGFTSSMLIGVSQTSDPTGKWNLQQIVYDPTNVLSGDVEEVGFNKNWIVVQCNLNKNGTHAQSNLYVFDKANVYGGGTKFTLISDTTIGGVQTPALTYDNTTPTLYLVQKWFGNSNGNGVLRLYTITGPVGSEVLTPITYIMTPNPWQSVPAPGGFNSDFAPQLGSTNLITTQDDTIRSVVYRNGTLWFAHTVFLPATGTTTRTAVQWWQLDVSGNILQRGRIDDPTNAVFYAFPSIAVNKNDDVTVGYSRFSAQQYASANYSFRSGYDPPNTMRGDTVLQPGLAPYFKLRAGTTSRNRWGDYSNTQVDPTNDLDMWTIQEYAAMPSGGSDRWGTWWGKIAPPAPGANQAPMVNAGAPQTINLPAGVSLVASVFDDGLPNPPGSLTLSWTKTSGPGTVTFSAPTSASTNASFSVDGTYVLQLTANDGALSTSSSVTITVNPAVNQAPAVSAGGDQTITLPSGATLNGTATDDGLPNPPGALTLSWTMMSGPGTVTFANPAAASTTATFSAAGTYVLQLTANDGALSSSSSVTITVNPRPNQAPVVSAGSAQTITLPAAASLVGTATDDGLPNPPGALTLSWSKVSGPGTVTFGSPSALTTSASFLAVGTYVLRLTANDGALTGSSDVTLTVNPSPSANQAPTVNAGADQTITLPAGATLNGTAADDGLPNPPGAVTLSWTKMSGPGTVTFGTPAALGTTATFSAAGTYVLQLTASDGSLSTGSTLTVTVNPPVNQPPVVSAGANQTITLPAAANLAGTATDDGLPNPPGALTLSWTQISGPGTVSFGSAAAAATTATFPAAGTYVLQLAASDGALTTRSTVTVTVNPPTNHAPVVSAGAAQTITLPAAANLDGLATDDGLPNPPGTLTLNWTMVNGAGTVIFGNAASATTTAMFSAAGQYTLRLTANDGALTGSANVTITVNPPVNQAPVVRTGADQTITLPAAASLTGLATDDGLPNPPGKLTLLWTQGSGPGTVTFGTPAASNTTATFSAPGVYVLHLTANDGALTGSSTVTVTVNPPVNQPPAVNAGPDQTIALPASASLSGTATDDGLPNPPGALTLDWTQVSGPGTATFGTPHATGTTASFSAPGVYALRLTASDGALSASSTVTVTVNPAVNHAPVVSAGTNQAITLPAVANLSGTAMDDGLPNPPGSLTLSWSKVNGPGVVTFGDATSAATTATFSTAGTYVLRLMASDGALVSGADVTVIVNPTGTPGGRVTNGLAALYTFQEGTGTSINDVSGVGAPLNLTLADPTAAHWVSGALSITAATILQSAGAATKVIAACKASNEVTIEAWVKPAGTGSAATERIAALSADNVNRNFFLAQTGNTYEAHLRASTTNNSGITMTTPAGSATTQLTHVVFERDAGGTATFYVNGTPEPTASIPGTFGTWDATYKLYLANEPTLTRAWTGELHLVAIYSHALTAAEVSQNLAAGPTGVVPPTNQPPTVSAGPDQTITLPEAANLAGTATDDGLPNPPGALTLSWTQLNGPGTTTFGDSSAAATTASFSQPGTYVLQLAANDGAVSESSTTTITVNGPGSGNQPPAVSSGSDQTITLPASANLSGTATDDGLPNPPGALTLSWTKETGPGTVTFGTPAAAATTATFSAAGTYILQLTANDGALSTSSSVTVTVNPPINHPPTVSAGVDQTVTLPAGASLSGTAADDGLPNPPGALTLSWTKVSGPGTVVFGAPAAAATTAAFSTAGSYVLQLTANDGAISASSTLTVTVNAGDGFPTVQDLAHMLQILVGLAPAPPRDSAAFRAMDVVPPGGNGVFNAADFNALFRRFLGLPG